MSNIVLDANDQTGVRGVIFFFFCCSWWDMDRGRNTEGIAGLISGSHFGFNGM